MMTRPAARAIGIGLVVALLAACGGGGGDSGSSGFDYDGNTSQAQLSEANSRAFVAATIDGTTGGDTLVTRSDDPAPRGGVDLTALGETLVGTVVRSAGGPTTAAQVSESATEDGECGGSLRVEITFDDQTGVFDGSIDFRDFDDCINVVDGRVGYSGELDPGDSTLEVFLFATDLLSVISTEEEESVDLSGEIETDVVAPDNFAVIYDLAFRVDGEVFRLEDYTVDMDLSISPASVAYDGRVYHPEHGYVDVETTDDVRILLDEGATPQAGTIVYMGSGGATATVTFTSVDGFMIEIDEDGDGGPDVTIECTWISELCT